MKCEWLEGDEIQQVKVVVKLITKKKSKVIKRGDLDKIDVVGDM